jgi:ubiquinone/menaquinone biosynthesis C-methylase UbiE
MARIPYDEPEADAFAASRHLTDEGSAAWRDAVTRHLSPLSGTRLLDLGSGTGAWAQAFSDWFGVEVVAVEPSEAMRARSAYQPVVAGDAAAIPLGDASVDAAWISTVIHHVPDLVAAARELRRVVRPGGPVLMREAFAGRHEQITLFRFFPEAVRVLDTYPTVEEVSAAFTATGFPSATLEQVQQISASSLAEAAATMSKEAHTPLHLLTDEEYAAGLDRMRDAAGTEPGPVVDTLDLLVLR